MLKEEQLVEIKALQEVCEKEGGFQLKLNFNMLNKSGKKGASKRVAILLEVEAKNAHALRLYEACGFRSYHSQDSNPLQKFLL